ncbi:MAG: type I 3-dehydroquinate dehydratase [Chthoniobacterales bacterium]|nr:type I 3-dehydroquinate dehydratase [Chthoniobacterales bacterium]
MNFFSTRIVGILHTEACLKNLSEEGDALQLPGIDLLEIRLDALPHGCLIPKKWPLPVIATARDPKEGGQNNLFLQERQQLLTTALSWANIIDIELASAKEFSPIITMAHDQQCEVILSYHNFKTTPSLKELEALASQAAQADATIFKVATTTSSEEELERLLEFQQLSHPLPVATMGMGSLGKTSRLRLAATGSALVYGWLYEPLTMIPASTQWSARELARFIGDDY